MDILITILFALFGGILPAIAWLWFWLKEDGSHPEPNRLIIWTFSLGMAAVPLAFIFEFFVNLFFLNGTFQPQEAIKNSLFAGIIVIIIWALIEEVLKFIAAYIGGLKKRTNDEPIDPIIYLITASLGFAALENTLFIFTPLLDGNFSGAFITSNLRFVGATLLHVTSSAIIGFFVAFSYFKKRNIRKRFLIFGFLFAIMLHSLFNFFIIKYDELTLLIFGVVWILIITIIILFEKIKKIHLNRVN